MYGLLEGRMWGRLVRPDGEGWTGSWDWQHTATDKFLLWPLWDGSHHYVNTRCILKDILAAKAPFSSTHLVGTLQGTCNVILKFAATSDSFLTVLDLLHQCYLQASDLTDCSLLSDAACMNVVNITEQRVCADGDLLWGVERVPEASTQV